MPLTPPVSVREVEALGSLIPELFDTDQIGMDEIVQSAIDFGDAWLQGHAGLNYGITDPAWAPILQRRGVMYLALESLTDILKSKKVYGTHHPYMSEDSTSYTTLLSTDWGARAMASLDLWVTVEPATGGGAAGGGATGFALPYFGITDPVPTNTDETNGLEPLEEILEEDLSYARGLSQPILGSVRR